MRRTKEWWNKLTKQERSELVWLEKTQHHYGYSAYYPDDCGECGSCGNPSLGGGLCNLCNNRLIELLNKVNGQF